MANMIKLGLELIREAIVFLALSKSPVVNTAQTSFNLNIFGQTCNCLTICDLIFGLKIDTMLMNISAF